MNTKTSTVMTDIYDLGDVKAERFAIRNFNSQCGKVKYLDEPTVSRSNEMKEMDGLYMSGGAEKKTASTVKREMYPSINDMPDADVKAFLSVCHVDDITAKPKPNAVFIIPTSSALDKIKADIAKVVGSSDTTSIEAVKKIKTEKLLYKLFILDSFGKDKDNAKFEYRLPFDYPEKFDSSIIYRRTTKYESKALFLKLEKSGVSVSASSDMSNAIKCDYKCTVGSGDTYFATVFTGDITSLAESKSISNSKSSYKVSELYKKYIHSEVDIDDASEKFVGAMIKNFGVNSCLPYYSANMVHSAFAMISAFGDKTDCTDCNDAAFQHGEMMKVYSPKAIRSMTKNNMNKVTEFSENFIEHLNQKTAAQFFKAIRSGYMQIMPEVKDTEFFDNEIAADTAFSIYTETNNVNLAIQTANEVKAACNGESMSNYKLKNIIPYLASQPMVGIAAKQFFPMVNISETAAEAEPVVIKGGEPSDPENLELQFQEVM